VLFVQHISKNGCRDVVWIPVKNLAFTADVNGTYLDQKYSGTILSPGTPGVAKPAARRETAGVLLCVLTRKTANGESHPKYPPWSRVLNQAVCRFFGASHQGENDA